MSSEINSPESVPANGFACPLSEFPPKDVTSGVPRAGFTPGRAICLCSGGLDSLLCLCVLREQGVHAEALVFTSPFFAPVKPTQRSVEALGFVCNTVDFTAEISKLLKNPPSGFGSCLNPCIDCHAAMIRCAWAWAQEHGFDFVATGEVLSQRPMSQVRSSLNRVRNLSGAGDVLLRPLSARLLEETPPEAAGKVDRSRLLALQGRNRKPQMELAKYFGIKKYPAPAGGCKLTEKNYCRRLTNLMEHEGIDDPRLLQLLNHGRHFRFPAGSLVILGRDRVDNEFLRTAMRGGDVTFRSVNVPGPTALAIQPSSDDLPLIRRLIAAYSDCRGIDHVTIREMHTGKKPEEFSEPLASRDPFQAFLL